MAYARKVGGDWQPAVDFIDESGPEPVRRTVQWIEGVSPSERAAAGVVAIVEPAPASAEVIVLGTRLIDVAGVPHREWITEPVDLDQVKAGATRAVNEAAGAFRLQFITDIPGQQATYLAKEEEARRYQANAGAGEYPYLTAEAIASGTSVGAIVALVIATAEAWRALDPKIEGARRGACVAIAAATSAAAARAAAQVNWVALLSP